ncbi:MAG: PqqD family protein [Lachnospiraceae bacterium]|nr:PqqD family protein [Lachnospiraceae bacterium]
MKIKEGFVLRKMPGMNMVMPIGENIKTYKGSVMLNETSAFIYEKLVEGKSKEEAAKALTEEYDVDIEKAMQSVERTCADFIEAGIAE